ncbi:hypothetical protein QR680_002156 [Steinernema hermaphroditum]|uniref:Uncharacterized protein n=1 Tax=Steinernema hermaphroditum TaxID=289476 RepID=A0AA39H2F1_9BILA|nr:hypothetical protein QR680_002156 [Steinernema hermaphroditum]
MNVFVSVNVHGELLTELHFQHTTQNLQLKMSCDKVWSTVSTALNFPVIDSIPNKKPINFRKRADSKHSTQLSAH